MMIELSLKLPPSIYNQLQTAARRENKPVNVFLIALISQRFSSLTPPPVEAVEHERVFLYDHQFVTEWTLPNP
jgi:hypothetical protein